MADFSLLHKISGYKDLLGEFFKYLTLREKIKLKIVSKTLYFNINLSGQKLNLHIIENEFLERRGNIIVMSVPEYNTNILLTLLVGDGCKYVSYIFPDYHMGLNAFYIDKKVKGFSLLEDNFVQHSNFMADMPEKNFFIVKNREILIKSFDQNHKAPLLYEILAFMQKFGLKITMKSPEFDNYTYIGDPKEKFGPETKIIKQGLTDHIYQFFGDLARFCPPFKEVRKWRRRISLN